jgi:hypothetical protein
MSWAVLCREKKYQMSLSAILLSTHFQNKKRRAECSDYNVATVQGNVVFSFWQNQSIIKVHI